MTETTLPLIELLQKQDDGDFRRRQADVTDHLRPVTPTTRLRRRWNLEASVRSRRQKTRAQAVPRDLIEAGLSEPAGIGRLWGFGLCGSVWTMQSIQAKVAMDRRDH